RPQRQFDLPVCQRPAQRGAEVVVLRFQPREPLVLLPAPEMWLGRPPERAGVRGVAPPGGAPFLAPRPPPPPTLPPPPPPPPLTPPRCVAPRTGPPPRRSRLWFSNDSTESKVQSPKSNVES